MIDVDIEKLNKQLRCKTPDEIIKFILTLSENRIVTTSFGMYSAILLSTIYKHDNDIKVIWCDTLYNQPSTYKHADDLIKNYNLKIHKYQSLKTKEDIEATIGVPSLEDDNHAEFSEVVKLEPFRRALKEHQKSYLTPFVHPIQL